MTIQKENKRAQMYPAEDRSGLNLWDFDISTLRLIDTAGQITAVITSKIDISELPKLSKFIMDNDKRVEQVGYLQDGKFRMMGEELSINGLLASEYIKDQTTTSVSLPSSIILDISGNIIYLQGINYKVIRGFPQSQSITPSTKKSLKSLAVKTKASGIVYYEKNTIKPLVYVKDTGSYVWEKACGSGSLAYSLVTGKRSVIQPSGKSIRFRILANKITVTETVKEI